MELNPDKIKRQLDYDKKFKNCGFATKAIHVGNEPDGIYGGVSVPINLSTTYAQNTPADPIGPFDYSRCGNPTRFSLERCLAAIENAKFQFTDFSDINILKNHITERTKMLWIESPTNPTLKVTDIELVVKTIKELNKDIIIVVDNTFMSPYNVRPLDLGADIVMESATKYLGGHSDVVMGTISTNDDDLRERLYFISKSMGAVPSPFDCYLMLRGLKTLSIRMERINYNALKIAQYLENNTKYVESVIYGGLESNVYHIIAKKQQRGFGGIISFYVKGGLESAKLFLQSLKIFTLAESLGAVESLAESPALMTHASVTPEKRKELGISDNLIRLSIGIEEVEDLINDLNNAFYEIKVVNKNGNSSEK